MNKSTKSLAFFLLLSSIILPILPTITVAQEETHVFKLSASALPDEWDPAVTDWYNVIWGSYGYIALQYPIGTPSTYSQGTTGPIEDEWVGILCTDWELERWPSEENVFGFNNTGGIKSATYTLRENVTFHDGSDWNATVWKWNIDRVNMINGNYTGLCENTDDNEAEGNNMHTIPVEDYKDYFTPGWNMSHYDSPNLGTTPPSTDPSILDYAYYNLGPNASLVDYGTAVEAVILPNNTLMNPAPYGGWDFGSGAAVNYAPYDRYPIVNYVEILENPQSGGKIKVHFNHWTTSGLAGAVNYPMISYDAYHEDYTTRGIYGYENGVSDPRNAGLVDHMIGTGSYIYVEHDQTGTPPGGYMLKNENYWNKTALEADGWFDVDRYEVINFPTGQLGKDAQNTAMLTHAIDFAYDSMYMPLDFDAVEANDNIQYRTTGSTEYKTNIVLNSINETWWAWPWADGWRQGFYTGAGDKPAGGMPRALRKAMGYAFNYDIMIHTYLNDRAIRGAGMLGQMNIYYNDTLTGPDYLAYYNKTKARDILLTTETDPLLFNISTPTPHTPNPLYGAGYPYGDHNAISLNPDNYNFSKMCADRGLTASSTDNDWRYVADNNPIYVVNFYWDSAHEDLKNVFQTSLRDIGCALKDETGVNNRVTTIIWDTVRIGSLATFDGSYGIFSCNAWVMDEHLPHDSPELNLFWAHVDPDRGRWRTYGAGGIASWHFWGNYGFNFDAGADTQNDYVAVSDPMLRKRIINDWQIIEQTEVYPKIWCYEAKSGWALWKDWDYFVVPNRLGYIDGFWGGMTISFLNYVGLEEGYALIPGSPLFITLTVSAISTIGIVYAIMRKKKLR
jgi:ABC-type transport system substrate-binding protein